MKRSIPDKTFSFLWSLIWFALPLSMRATVLFLWIFGVAVIIQTLVNGIQPIQRKQLITSALLFLFLIAQVISLFFDSDTTLWWKSLEKKSALLVIPLLLLFVDQKKYMMEKWAIKGFLLGLTIAGFIMIGSAISKSFNGGGVASWSYHEFASPLKIGAIYLSWYYASAVIYLASRRTLNLNPLTVFILILFFVLLILLLASKLFIILTIPFVIYMVVLDLSKIRFKIAFLLISLILIATVSFPFIKRMAEIANTNIDVVKQDTFTYDTPFDGLTFRLIQWRFAVEILNQESAWITGVGINSSQQKLDAHYQLKGVYTGNPDLGDQGYLGYNYHNQYLETLVSTGIIGLCALMLIIMNVFFRFKNKLLFPLYVYIITMLFFFTESVLDRQAGIIFFCLIVLTNSVNYTTTYGSRIDESRRS